MRRVVSALLMGGLVAASGLPARADRLSLPNETRAIALPESVGAALAEALHGDAFAALPQDWTDRLVRQIGPDYTAACNDVTAHWGAKAGRPGRLMARWLARAAGHTWIALRCGVDQPELADYADERLVVFRDRPEDRRLFLIGHRPDCEHCTELTRLEPLAPLSTAAGPAVGIRIAVSTDNPCCGGPHERYETTRSYYLLDREHPRIVLTLVERREEGDHTDPERDFISVYEARIEPQHDARGRVTAVVADYTVTINDVVQKRGRVAHRWSATESRFVTVQR